MTTFFIGCTHFGHARIIDLAKRPFRNVGEMDEYIISGWNARVMPEDTVWHLGDFAFCNHGEYFRKLNGNKCLVIGNHDEGAKKLPWYRAEHTVIENIDGQWFHLHHYPLEEWQGYFRKSIHLHSHTHGTRPNVPGRLDVGVERLLYEPMSVEDIMTSDAIKEWTRPPSHKD